MFETPEKTMTLEAFLAFIEEQQADDTNYELHQGVITQMPPSKTRQGVIAMLLGGQILNFVLEHKLGYVAGADAGFKIAPGDFYAPDAAFYSHTRLPNRMPEDDYVDVAPDLAAEVVSENDQYSVQDKARRYIALGVKIVWVVYPKRQIVDVYRPTDDGGVVIHTLKVDDALDGGDVLPGFSLPVKKAFGI